ncbi:MAG TPA: hypothetical protein VFX30_06530 [bacterium]|nr:hypothetical protein [bacterium]
MRFLFASLAIVLSMTGFPAFAGETRTLSDKNAEYAQSLFKDKWREHLPEISQNWKKYVGGLDISKADNPKELEGFFSFVINTDPAFAPAFERAKRSLERAESHFGAMEQEADDGDHERFRHDLVMGTARTQELTDTVLHLQAKMLDAVAIYGAPLKKIAYPPPRGGLFGRLQNQFADRVTEKIGQTVEVSLGRGTRSELGPLNGVLRELFDAATFGYIGKDGQKDFISFVNFGGDSPRATPAPYVQFLWF